MTSSVGVGDRGLLSGMSVRDNRERVPHLDCRGDHVVR